MDVGYVALILEKDGRFLVEKRLKKPDNKQMEVVFPGGRVENGETPEEAVVREVIEELSIKVRDPILAYSDLVHQRDGKRINWYYCNQYEGNIEKRTAFELKWILPSEYEILSYRNSREALKVCVDKFSRSD